MIQSHDFRNPHLSASTQLLQPFTLNSIVVSALECEGSVLCSVYTAGEMIGCIALTDMFWLHIWESKSFFKKR